MKLRNKILISITAGLLAMLLYSSPMWWGVLFSPLSQPLTTAELSEDNGGVRWESEGVVLRFKSLAEEARPMRSDGLLSLPVLFLERKSTKKNFNLALQRRGNPAFSHGNGAAFL